ncbi:MAG: hypothetical protein OEV44_12705 [Spirochaetota bacterium]|nr:hypothetical protein [Spirochaetota bacterium]
MVNAEVFKKIMNSFNSMKGHLNNLERDYSLLLEKSEALYQQKEEANSIS